jgi:hypothetical protein
MGAKDHARCMLRYYVGIRTEEGNAIAAIAAPVTLLACVCRTVILWSLQCRAWGRESNRTLGITRTANGRRCVL